MNNLVKCYYYQLNPQKWGTTFYYTVLYLNIPQNIPKCLCMQGVEKLVEWSN
jgi:hypothetical protein